MSALFIILVGLTRWHYLVKKCLFTLDAYLVSCSTWSKNLEKTFNSQAAMVCAECVNLLEKFKSSKRYTEEFFSKLSCTMGSNQFWRTIRICLFKGWCLEKVGYAGWAAAADVSRLKSVTLYVFARYQSTAALHYIV